MPEEKLSEDKQKDVCESVGHPQTAVKILVWIYELELDGCGAGQKNEYLL